MDRVSSLKNTELFRALDDGDLEKLSTKLRERVYPPNTAIVREGASGDAMFIIKNGQVEVKKREQNLGVDLTIATLGMGACFGEMALLTGKPRSATVMAIAATELFVLEKKDFDALLLEHPSISISINKIVAERIEEMNTQKTMGVVSMQTLKIDPDFITVIPEAEALKYKMLATSYGNGSLTIAMVNPQDILALDEARRLIKAKFTKSVALDQVIVTEEDFKQFMEGEYKTITKPLIEEKPEVNLDDFLDSMDHIQSDIMKDVEFDEGQEDDSGITDLAREAEGAPIIRLTNNIIAMALKKGASDIHIEPMEKEVRVRFRIDGDLYEEMILPKKVQLPLISRVKIISKLDITERRLPQDGRITLKMGSKSVDFRVSTVPAKFGEKICTRILDKSNTTLGLDKLITHPPVLSLVRDMIKRPYGIIYVTGPTGSGKSTTLYSSLAEINDVKRNISTVEDPIEYDLRGVNQIQVNPDIGLDFARVLRAFLRQDPDIILVGETRDTETPRSRWRRPHRPPGLYHTPRQRRPRYSHAPHRDGYRTVPRLRVRHRHRRPASRPKDLRKVQGALPRSLRPRIPRPASRHTTVQGPGMRRLRRHRVQGQGRGLRGPRGYRGDPPPHSGRRRHHGHQGCRNRRRNEVTPGILPHSPDRGPHQR